MDGAGNGTDWTVEFHLGTRFWILGVFTPIVTTIGIIGNAVTIVVLTRKRMKSSTNTYLTALATSDLFYVLGQLVLSFWHHPTLKDPAFLIVKKMWGTLIWLTDATSAMSVWMTVSFTLERYIAVCYPLRGKVICTESRARRVVLGVVVLSLLLTATTPFEWGARLETVEGTNVTVVELYPTALSENHFYKTYINGSSSLIVMIIPFFLLLVLNTFLIMTVRKSQRQRSNLTEDCRGMTGSVRQSSRKSKKLSIEEDGSHLTKRLTSGRRAYKEKQENKITMALISVVCLFLVCQSPTATFQIVNIIYQPKSPSEERVKLALGCICNFLVLINATTNFLLYCAMSDKYRQTLLMTFCSSSRVSRSNSNTYSYGASFRHSIHHHQDHH